jgi:hypothetical protein
MELEMPDMASRGWVSGTIALHAKQMAMVSFDELHRLQKLDSLGI